MGLQERVIENKFKVGFGREFSARLTQWRMAAIIHFAIGKSLGRTFLQGCRPILCAVGVARKEGPIGLWVAGGIGRILPPVRIAPANNSDLIGSFRHGNPKEPRGAARRRGVCALEARSIFCRWRPVWAAWIWAGWAAAITLAVQV